MLTVNKKNFALFEDISKQFLCFRSSKSPQTWRKEMSKVEKSGSVEVKVVKTEDEGGEFHTQQVGIFLFISKGFSI